MRPKGVHVSKDKTNRKDKKSSRMKKYHVYIIQCSDGSYYTGISNDIERRLREHNEGKDSKSFTFNRRPVRLKFSTSFTNSIDAIRFEKQVKGWSRAKKEALINGEFKELIALAKKKW